MGCVEKVIEGGRVLYRDCATGKPAAPQPPQAQDGPGTELKAILLKWFGIKASLGCSCNAMARKMNANGPEWCEGPGMPEIMSAMRTEHGKRKTILPWSETAAMWLIRKACKNARAKSAVDKP
jgi:hypothetical protein